MHPNQAGLSIASLIFLVILPIIGKSTPCRCVQIPPSIHPAITPTKPLVPHPRPLHPEKQLTSHSHSHSHPPSSGVRIQVPSIISKAVFQKQARSAPRGWILYLLRTAGINASAVLAVLAMLFHELPLSLSPGDNPMLQTSKPSTTASQLPIPLNPPITHIIIIITTPAPLSCTSLRIPLS